MKGSILERENYLGGIYKGQPSHIQQHISKSSTNATNIARSINNQKIKRLSAL